MKAILLFLCLMGTGGLVAQNAASLGLQEQLIETWSNGSYQNSQRATYTNDANGFFNHIHGELWNGTEWYTSSQVNYTITPQGNVGSVTNQQWNTDNNQWVNSIFTTWTYANGKISQVITQQWIDENWQNLQRATYHYDANNYLTHIDRDQWSTDDNAWHLNSREVFTNSPSGLATGIMYKIYVPASQTWIDYLRTTQNHDSNGNLIYKFVEVWFPTGWVNSSQSTYSYDSSQRIIHGVTQAWSYMTSEWDISYRETYTYGTLGVSAHETSSITLYPNPAADRLEIAGIGEAKLVEIYGIDGKRQKMQATNNSMDVSALAAGTYILSVETEKGISKAKFIKQ